MKRAEELYEITQKRIPEIVDKVMDGAKEHIVKRCEEEANKGAVFYTFYLKEVENFVENVLFDECIKLAHEFEEMGYKIEIGDYGNGYFLNYIFTISWDKDFIKKMSLHNNVLYTTEKGIINLKEDEE